MKLRATIEESLTNISLGDVEEIGSETVADNTQYKLNESSNGDNDQGRDGGGKRKRGRCSLCDRSIDKEVRNTCDDKYNSFVCSDHSKMLCEKYDK